MEIVLDFFQANRHIAYSTTTLAHKFKMKRSALNHYLHNCDLVYNVDPLTVGSGKAHINVFKWKKT